MIASGEHAVCVPFLQEQPNLDYCVQSDIDRLSCICYKTQFLIFIEDSRNYFHSFIHSFVHSFRMAHVGIEPATLVVLY